MCEHKNFAANVDVNRLCKTDGGPAENYSADIKIRCADCGEQFEFIGAPGGLSYKHPTTSADFTELRVPIRPFTNNIQHQNTFEINPPLETPKKDLN